MRIFKSHPLLKLVNSYLIDSPQPSNLSYLWNFGSLLAFCLIIQIVTGVTLAMHYNPSVLEAFNSVEHIMRDVNNGWLIRYLHSNTASAFFFIVYLHIGRGLYYGSYRAPRTLVWTLGTVIFILMIVTAFLGFDLLRSPTWFKHNNNNNNINNKNNKINNNNNNNYAKDNKKIILRSNILEVAINTINKGSVTFNRVWQFIVDSNYICLSVPLSLQPTHQACFFNINEWLYDAQVNHNRPLERVLRDLQTEIGGLPESKKKIVDGLNRLMYKYTDTFNPHGINVNNGPGAPTNLQINRENMVALANFKIKIQREVSETHVTPPPSDDGYSAYSMVESCDTRSLLSLFVEANPFLSALCLLFIVCFTIIAYFIIRALYNKYKLKIKNKFKSIVNIIKSVYTTKNNDIAPVFWEQKKNNVFNYMAMSNSKYLFLHKNTFMGSTSYRRVLPIYFLYRKKNFNKFLSNSSTTTATFPDYCRSEEVIKFIKKQKLNPILVYENINMESIKARLQHETRFLAAIYLILNKITIDYYIGSATTGKLHARLSNHLFNFHGSKVVKNAVKKHGISSFAIIVLELFPEEVNKENNKQLLDLEDFYLKSLLPNYNIFTEAGSSFGYKHSDISRLKMKASYSEERRVSIGSLNKGKSLSPNTIELMMEAVLNRTKPIYSEEPHKNMKKNSKAILAYNMDYTVNR